MLARALALLSIALLGCADSEPRSLVLVSLDTVRRDHLSLYGYARQTSPHLDALAPGAVVFDEAFAQHVNTHPSHASMFTGLYPNVHGSIYNGMRLPPGPATLAELLADAGFRTAAFVSGATLVAQTGLDRGFEVYDDDLRGARRAGRDTVRLARAWLEARGPGERSFLFVHLFDAHGPYTPEQEVFHSAQPGQRLERIPAYQRVRDAAGEVVLDLNDYVDRYDAMIRYCDEQLGELLEAVDLERSVVVVLADHGETLGERYHVLDHGGQTTDEQTRIPLVIRAPGLSPRRVDGLVETVDLLPTLLELLGLPAPLDVQGHSLLPLLEGREDGKQEVFSSAVAVSARHADRGYDLELGGQIHALRTARWKLVRYPLVGGEALELFDLERDPGETTDLADAEPAVRDEKLAHLRTWMARGASSGAPARIGPELRRYLEQLGYAEP
jgi:arylsulfatase A-like enzyme